MKLTPTAILKVEDFWAYLVDEMVPSLYNTKWYNAGDNPLVSSDKETKTKVLQSSFPVLMGAPAIPVQGTSKTPMCFMTTRCWGCRGETEVRFYLLIPGFAN